MSWVLGTLLFALTRVSGLKNPVISGWNPDPAVLRVEDTYYMATSSFTYFPGIPIYKSNDLANWQLVSHALKTSNNLQLNGISTGEGVWAPGLSHINGRFYVTSMTRWGSNPGSRTWPRIWFSSSEDLRTWSDLIWAEPYGIDPDLFHDPITGKTYLNLMAPNNNYDRVWGISQCEINLQNGHCAGTYHSLWNGTLPHTASARPEGPKMFFREGFYYLMLAEGGTSAGHRVTIARSKSPEGPWDPAPNNPLIYNGADPKLTVQSTGHATFVDTPDGKWYASLLARRNINGASPLGREAFLTTVTWKDGWPSMNSGKPLLLSESIPGVPDRQLPPPPFVDSFAGSELELGWYQLRTPYTVNYRLEATKDNSSGILFNPNVFTLSDRDVPAAVLRKQKSLNMTFSAKLLPTDGGLGPRQSVGISAYLSELTHQDIGVRGCGKSGGLCVYTDLLMSSEGPWTKPNATEVPLNLTIIPPDLTLHIRVEPLTYFLGYSIGEEPPIWLQHFSSDVMSRSPGYPTFEGAMFALYASGNGEPWPFDAPDVGFKSVAEEYYPENIPDYDDWA